MGTNGVTMTDAQLKARALEIQKFYSESGMTLPESFSDKKTGAIFTYKKGTDGKLTCTYDYHNEKTKDLIFFERKTVPSSRAGLGYLTDEQFEEFKDNHPAHFYTSEYAAGTDSIRKKEHAENYLNSYDKSTRKQAEKDYQEIVKNELLASGSFDKKAAKKMSKYAKQDAKAGERSELREVYVDKNAFKAAEKQLKAEQKAAKERIKRYQNYAKSNALTAQDEIQFELDMMTMERSVKYIKDKDVRNYVTNPANRDRFYIKDANGAYVFSSEKYKEWAKSHTQGDNTLTTSERGNASMATGLSKGDVKKAVEYAGLDAQKDHTLKIQLAKTLVGVIAGPIISYMTNSNIHDIKVLKDKIEIVADSADPSKYTVFVDGVSIAEARSEVIANFRDVAVRNAVLASALATVLNNPWMDPTGARDRKAEGITAATISTQNIFRGKDEVNINGQVVIDDGGHEIPHDDDACYEIDGVDGTPGQEGTPDENVFPLRMNDKCNVIFWYQTADAYEIPDGMKKQAVYNAVRDANGDPQHNKYAPDVVGLPEYLEIKDKNGNIVKVKRKEHFEIKGQCYTPPPNAKKLGGKGKTYQGRKGTAAVQGTPGNFRVYDCQTGHVYVSGLPSRQAAENWIWDHQSK